MSLIIVESPTKAKTFNRILKNKDYFVFATFGHIRDLPKNKLGIDYQHQFAPDYQIIPSKKKVIKEMKNLAKENKEIILATDLDREGESIAYHIGYFLGFIKEEWPDFFIKKNKITLKRIVFHEITADALTYALKKPQALRINLVKAQQARRILDRIVGYELSPLLWKIMGKKWLSAGRVQTVALRLIVEREKEIKLFKVEKYFQIYATFNKEKLDIKAKLIKKNDDKYEQKIKLSLFDGHYQYTKTKIDQKLCQEIIADLNKDSFKIMDIKEEVFSRQPPPPFITSSLQQEAFNKFGFSSKLTMRLAQNLYEQGLITYHRTDSFHLADSFLNHAKNYLQNTFGKNYLLDKPRIYRTKSKSAQEAHEAIRPTRLDIDFTSKSNKNFTKNHQKLFQLIFDRAVSTQMKEAQIKAIKVQIFSDGGYFFEANITQVVFDGFLRLLNPAFVAKHQTSVAMKKGDRLKIQDMEPQELETRPPPRYTEASLIKSLEEKGIGRPSTYASIVSLIQEKNYVEKDNRNFIPTTLGQTISDYLSENFSQLFDINFTAQMEDNLDLVADNKLNMIKLLTDFYQPFSKLLKEKKAEKKTINIEEKVDEKCPLCQSDLIIRFSKYGKFYACSNFPQCKFTKPFVKYVENKFCPLCGGRLVIRFTKKRKRFYGCENWPKCKYATWII